MLRPRGTFPGGGVEAPAEEDASGSRTRGLLRPVGEPGMERARALRRPARASGGGSEG